MPPPAPSSRSLAEGCCFSMGGDLFDIGLGLSASEEEGCHVNTLTGQLAGLTRSSLQLRRHAAAARGQLSADSPGQGKLAVTSPGAAPTIGSALSMVSWPIPCD